MTHRLGEPPPPILSPEEVAIQREAIGWVALFLARVTYKPGYVLSVRPFTGMAAMMIGIAYKPPDAEAPAVRIDLQFRRAIHFGEFLAWENREEMMIMWMRSTLMELEEHELDEWFRVDRVRVVEPHPRLDVDDV